MKNKLSIILISVVVGLINVLFGDLMLTFLGIGAPELRVQISSILATFVLSTGFLIAIYSLLEENKNELQKLERDLILDIKRSIPTLDVVNFYTGSDGLKEVAGKLENAKKVLNTRIIPSNYVGPVYNKDTEIWNENIIESVINGVTFIDIVSGKGIDSSKVIMKNLEKRKSSVKGSYKRIDINYDLESFLNFKIIYLKDERMEVWIGWRFSKNSSSMDASCFRSLEANIIKMFEDWHGELHRSAKHIEVFPETGL